MARRRVDKVLVTNRSVLRAKYGAGYAKSIRPAVRELIAADRRRGLHTVFVPLDDAQVMDRLGASPVSGGEAPQYKRAIDAVFRALEPDYLCILGSIDVVPHQSLVNPLSGRVDDFDGPYVPSDLPYACDRTRGKHIESFLAPTRVVGRLPNVTGDNDPAYLASLLQTAAQGHSLPRRDYEPYLGITAERFDPSTELSLQHVLGNSTDVQDVPPHAPPWPGLIDRLTHFINCHGGNGNSRFFGEPRLPGGALQHYPALDAAQLDGLRPGTVASVECCFGAQLYDPKTTENGQAAICNAYLGHGAYGYFGSTVTAYGPDQFNAEADLICQFFLRAILSGASLGEAALIARLDFLRCADMSSPTNLKTLGTFLLLGDPSLRPVQPAWTGLTLVKGAVEYTRPAEVIAATRQARRQQLAALGRALARALVAVDTTAGRPALRRVRALLNAELARHHARPRGFVTFAVRRGPDAAPGAGPRAVHVALGELPGEAPFPRLVVVEAREQDRQLVLRRTCSH